MTTPRNQIWFDLRADLIWCSFIYFLISRNLCADCYEYTKAYCTNHNIDLFITWPGNEISQNIPCLCHKSFTIFVSLYIVILNKNGKFFPLKLSYNKKYLSQYKLKWLYVSKLYFTILKILVIFLRQ